LNAAARFELGYGRREAAPWLLRPLGRRGAISKAQPQQDFAHGGFAAPLLGAGLDGRGKRVAKLQWVRAAAHSATRVSASASLPRS
jgi:hypothetical protein